MNSNSNIGTVTYTIKLDTTQLDSGLNEVKSKLSDLGSSGQSDTRSLSDGLLDISLGVSAISESASSLSSVTNSINSVVSAYQSYQSAMAGVEAVASATGNSVSESMQAVQQATASGLVSQSDAAAAVKNLELYGYTAQQAAQMLQVLTDAAVYNRQANYSVSEAVRVTTEGIRMENSVLSDASGITTNIAKMQQNYAQQLGVSYTSLTQAQKAHAVYNGVMQEGGIFAGNAAEYTETLAGAQLQLDTATKLVQAQMGSMFESFAPIISGLASWVAENKELVAGLATFAGIVAAGGILVTGIVATVKAISAIRTALIAMSVAGRVATGSLGALVAIFALMAAIGVANSDLSNFASTADDTADASNDAADGIESIGTSAADTADRVADLRKQIEELTRDYRRDLKQILVDHEETIQSLTTQIEEANVDYKRAIDERTAEFNVTLAEQAADHQTMVNDLMTQLAFLQRYNNQYNAQKLAQVQFALAKEQTLYQQQTAALQEQLAIQNAADKASYQQKLADLQAELAEEQAFMEKHREVLNGVRDVMLLDEIESLTERYEAQKASYEQQILEAQTAGSSIGDGFATSLEEALNETDFSSMGVEMGQELISGFFDGMEEMFLGRRGTWDGIFGDLGQFIYNLSNGNFGFGTYDWVNGEWVKRGYATGGYTGHGSANEIAGVVHRGEYVIPASQVDQSTGLPKSSGITQNITINLSGTFATSAADRRKVALQIQDALAQVAQTRLA